MAFLLFPEIAIVKKDPQMPSMRSNGRPQAPPHHNHGSQSSWSLGPCWGSRTPSAGGDSSWTPSWWIFSPLKLRPWGYLLFSLRSINWGFVTWSASVSSASLPEAKSAPTLDAWPVRKLQVVKCQPATFLSGRHFFNTGHYQLLLSTL